MKHSLNEFIFVVGLGMPIAICVDALIKLAWGDMPWYITIITATVGYCLAKSLGMIYVKIIK